MKLKDTKRILIVDDDDRWTDSLKELLSNYGYEAKVMRDGDNVAEIACSWYPHLILLDVMMRTDTEGFDVSRDLSNYIELKGVPVVLLTGIRQALGISEKIKPDVRWLPVKAVLEKPVVPNKLLNAIKEYAA